VREEERLQRILIKNGIARRRALRPAERRSAAAVEAARQARLLTKVVPPRNWPSRRGSKDAQTSYFLRQEQELARYASEAEESYLHALRQRRNNVATKYSLQTNVQHRLSARLRTRLHTALTAQVRPGASGWKNGSAVKDLGCDIPSLVLYLEARFQGGMTWLNWGNGPNKWNIDHIRPLASFDLTDRQQLLEACHYTNLQPLWSADNIRKSDTWGGVSE